MKRFFIIFIFLFFFIGCISKPHYKVYTHNILKEVVIPNDYNFDTDQCGKYSLNIAFSKGSIFTNRSKIIKELWEKCMEKKGWRVK